MPPSPRGQRTAYDCNGSTEAAFWLFVAEFPVAEFPERSLFSAYDDVNC